MKPPQTLVLFRVTILLAALWSGQYAFSASLTDQLTLKFQARMSTLDREVVAFRYEAKSKEGLTSIPAVQARVQGWGERFFDKAIVSADIAGPGNYMAIDPAGSRSFGSDNPQLFAFTLKKGIRILSLENSLKKDEKEIIKKIHNELQCKNKNGNEEKLIEDDRMDYFSLRQSSTEACRDLAIQVGQALNMQAILYSYTASNSLVGCRQRNSAFNVLSAGRFSQDSVSQNS